MRWPCNTAAVDTYSGGGLFIHSGGAPTINDCRFEDNWAKGGGGISVQSSSAFVTGCVFLRNFGDNRAGAVKFATSSNAVVKNCTFDSNVSYFGGALYFNQSSVGGLVDRCTFVDNDSVNGGAMFLAGFSTTNTTNCLFLRNECKQLTFFQTSFDGGAVKNWCTSSTFINCIFNGNRARGTGGAIVDAGPSGSHATIINCTIYGNYSRDGGAVGALSGHTPNLLNSIVWANTADGVNPISIVGGVVIASSNVQGLSLLTSGNANIDPQFNAPNGSDGAPATADDNLTLLGTSLLIDAGNNSLVPAGIITDFAGQGRFIDGNNDTIQTVDMGAFEYLAPPPHCYGDADGNLIINFSDITKILSNWGQTGPAGDSDDSGIVNFADITATLTAWGSDCNPA